VRPISWARWITEVIGMRVSPRASRSLSIPTTATWSGNAMPASAQACSSWRDQVFVGQLDDLEIIGRYIRDGGRIIGRIIVRAADRD
jgi:hypothetical protein